MARKSRALRVGSVVSLRSGGPEMTVTSMPPVEGDAPVQVVCKWFDNGVGYRAEVFDAESLYFVKD